MSVRPSTWNNSAPNEEFWWNLIVEYFSKICRQNSSSNKNWQKITGILHEGLCTFMIIFRSVSLRIRNVSDKRCTENQNTNFILNNFFRKSCRLWDNVEKYDTARQATVDSIIHRMRFACFINKATDAHSECVILIAFPRQQRLCERASMLRYTHNTVLFKFIIQFFCQSYCCHNATHTVKNNTTVVNVLNWTENIQFSMKCEEDVWRILRKNIDTTQGNKRHCIF